jgi:hypothetical protein
MSIESAREYANGLADNLREDAPDDIGEWLDGILDYQVTYSSQRELVSVRVLVAFGGPTAWVVFDGEDARVQATWYSDMVEVYVPRAPLSGPVFDYFQDVLAVA